MFIEKQPTKILSSVGAICKNGLNTHLFTYRSYGAFAFLPALNYKHFTPAGLRTLYFKGFTQIEEIEPPKIDESLQYRPIDQILA
jgi:hypothetical protein